MAIRINNTSFILNNGSFSLFKSPPLFLGQIYKVVNIGGSGGSAATFTSANGGAGNNYGAGGGGGGAKISGQNRSGGAGAKGLIRLIYR
jgi:hypothetical protein